MNHNAKINDEYKESLRELEESPLFHPRSVREREHFANGKSHQAHHPHSSSLLWEHLIDVLSDEVSVYERLLQKEKEKSEVIKEQAADKLRNISIEQKGMLNRRDTIEKNRNILMDQIRVQAKGEDIKRLSDLFKLDIPREFVGKLRELHKALRDHVYELQAIVETNRNMIQDNFEFFQQLLEKAARHSVDDFTYYLKEKGEGKGKKDKSAKPIFLDANC